MVKEELFHRQDAKCAKFKKWKIELAGGILEFPWRT